MAKNYSEQTELKNIAEAYRRIRVGRDINGGNFSIGAVMGDDGILFIMIGDVRNDAPAASYKLMPDSDEFIATGPDDGI